VLVIVVVNAARARARESWPLHAELLLRLRGAAARQVSELPPAWLSRRAHYDVLAIDRAHPDWCFPDKQGVGLARRIGCDVALALYAAERVEDPFLYCTDADARLPDDYFAGAPAALPESTAAIVFGFWHVPGGEAAIDEATASYELGLRYYVAGLAQAGSPYAHHAIGSALAVRATAYAMVRGFPPRLAGEDFYLLNKLAKVGSIWRDDQRTILLTSRGSSRTAHGTGMAALKAVREGNDAAPFYHPHIFDALRAWLQALQVFAECRDIDRARAELESLAGPHAGALNAVLDELGAWSALEAAARHTRGRDILRARLHTWFDGFRTLKLVHGLRAHGLASLPFRQALELTPYCSPAQAREAALDDLRRLLVEWQAAQSGQTGLAFQFD
jgi:hypothetical protein